MLYALSQEKKLILATKAQKGEKYYCPSCHQNVLLKKGSLRLPHFAHYKKQCQSFSEGETAQHLLGKQLLAQLFWQMGCLVQIEAYLTDLKQRPDLLVTTPNNVTYAIEYQCAPLSVKKMVARSRGYAKKGWKCWWILGTKHLLKQKMTQQKAQFMHYSNKVGCYLIYLDTQMRRLLLYYNICCDNFLHLRYQRATFKDLAELSVFLKKKHQQKSLMFSSSLSKKQQQQLAYLCWQENGILHQLQIACYQQHYRLQDIYNQIIPKEYLAPFFYQYPFIWQIWVFLQADCTTSQAQQFLQKSLFETPFIVTTKWQQNQIRKLQARIQMASDEGG